MLRITWWLRPCLDTRSCVSIILAAVALPALVVPFASIKTASLKAGEPREAFRAAAGNSVKDQVVERDVELFAAMREKDVTVEFSPLSSRIAWLKVANKSNDVLRIQLPSTFAGVPVLAQFGPGGVGLPGLGMPGGAAGNNLPGGNNLAGLGNFGAPGAGGQQGGQGVGGGFPQNINNGNGNQVGGNQNQVGNPFGNQLRNGLAQPGFFRVLPGRVGKMQALTVCLEHGKAEPSPRMKYQIIPLDAFTNGDARLAGLCERLAGKEISQNVAQAVAWHFANGLTWKQLAEKTRTRPAAIGSEKYFTDAEMHSAIATAHAIESSLPTQSTVDVRTSVTLQSSSERHLP